MKDIDYSRFTDRSRRIFSLASKHAVIFGHRTLEPEDLLLGLMSEPTGVAATAIRNFDLSSEMITREVLKLTEQVVAETLGIPPLSDSVDSSIRMAFTWAEKFNHSYIGTEHLLLGLLEEPNSVAVQVLVNLGASEDDLRDEIFDLLGVQIVQSKALPLKIAIDFDGTVVDHCFPKVGKDVPGAEQVLKELVSAGHKLILWTMRSDGHANNPGVLTDAVNWYKERGIPLYGINTDPEQSSWTSSPKCYAHYLVDDTSIGIPTVKGTESGRPCVDWNAIRDLFVREGVLPTPGWNKGTNV